VRQSERRYSPTINIKRTDEIIVIREDEDRGVMRAAAAAVTMVVSYLHATASIVTDR